MFHSGVWNSLSRGGSVMRYILPPHVWGARSVQEEDSTGQLCTTGTQKQGILSETVILISLAALHLPVILPLTDIPWIMDIDSFIRIFNHYPYLPPGNLSHILCSVKLIAELIYLCNFNVYWWCMLFFALFYVQWYIVVVLMWGEACVMLSVTYVSNIGGCILLNAIVICALFYGMNFLILLYLKYVLYCLWSMLVLNVWNFVFTAKSCYRTARWCI